MAYFRLCSIAIIGVWSCGTVLAAEFAERDIEFFEREVRPLLVEHCYECHSAQAEKLQGGLRLDSRNAVIAGGDTGAAIVPGDSEESLLVDAVRYGELYQMPPKSKLPAAAIQTLEEWVARGAPWPAELSDSARIARDAFNLEQRKASHWAWRPIVRSTVPEIRDESWPLDPIDRFVLSKLESDGLEPATAATPRALVRRAFFDVIGLPPPPDRVEAFAAQPSQQAFADLVDELLASPHFGERWGRHWLDLMRYAETRGHEYDHQLPNAWQYRDYVIRAFNADLPYDQFVTEHVAGDLLDEPRRHPEHGFNESVLGTAFWYLGDWVHSPVDLRDDEMNRFDSAIDVFGKAFLGLTVSCARCHDHKFDAIAQRDYYALAGFLQSSAYRQVRFESRANNVRVAAELDALEQETGMRVAAEIARVCQRSDERLESMITAAVEAIATGAGPDRSKEFAAKYDLSAETLNVWVEELSRAAGDSKHALHSLALLATQGAHVRDEWLRSSCVDLPETLSGGHQVVADFDSEQTPWLTDGPAYGTRPRRRGDVLLRGLPNDPTVEFVARGRAELLPRLSQLSLATGTERDAGKLGKWGVRPGRVLRTPTVELRGGKLYYWMRGGTQAHAVIDSHRLIEGPLHGTHLKDIPAHNELRWVEHDLTPYQGHRVHVEFGPRGSDSLQVLMVVEGASDPDMAHLSSAQEVGALLGNAASIERCVQQHAELMREAITRMRENRLGDSPAHRAMAQWCASNLSLWGDDGNDAIPSLSNEFQENRQALLAQLCEESATAPTICDGVGENEMFLVRGNVRTPRKPVPRAMLAAIAGVEQTPIEVGSGRLELARRLMDQKNPFPARVMANRVWHHLTGRGIVPSVDNFGVLGQKPTHSELLDHLAVRLVDGEWSIKKLIRTIMLSRTYQMASQATPQAMQVDPQNLMMHHMPTRRLQAEAIRDAILAVSGQIDLTQFGPSVPVNLTDFMQGKGRPKMSGPLDGDRRRSIYISVRRNFLSPMMLAFDAPQPTEPIGRRTVSNVPAQALILMNDPFVVEQARHFARRVLDTGGDADACIREIYAIALSRPPDNEELVAAREFLAAQMSEPSLDAEADQSNETVWRDLCHVVFNTKEFLFLP